MKCFIYSTVGSFLILLSVFLVQFLYHYINWNTALVPIITHPWIFCFFSLSIFLFWSCKGISFYEKDPKRDHSGFITLFCLFTVLLILMTGIEIVYSVSSNQNNLKNKWADNLYKQASNSLLYIKNKHISPLYTLNTKYEINPYNLEHLSWVIYSPFKNDTASYTQVDYKNNIKTHTLNVSLTDITYNECKSVKSYLNTSSSKFILIELNGQKSATTPCGIHNIITIKSIPLI